MYLTTQDQLQTISMLDLHHVEFSRQTNTASGRPSRRRMAFGLRYTKPKYETIFDEYEGIERLSFSSMGVIEIFAIGPSGNYKRVYSARLSGRNIVARMQMGQAYRYMRLRARGYAHVDAVRVAHNHDTLGLIKSRYERFRRQAGRAAADELSNRDYDQLAFII